MASDPYAICLLLTAVDRWAPLSGCSLRVRAFSLCPLSGSWVGVHAPLPMPRALVSRFPSVSGAFSQSRWLSRGLPVGCFLHVTVKCTCSASAVTGGLPIVLHPRPRETCLISATAGCFPAATCPSARVFVIRLPQGLLTEDTFAFDYPSALPTWGWTCPRDSAKLPLDRASEFGTLAERTSKQPGVARHTTTP